MREQKKSESGKWKMQDGEQIVHSFFFPFFLCVPTYRIRHMHIHTFSNTPNKLWQLHISVPLCSPSSCHNRGHFPIFSLLFFSTFLSLFRFCSLLFAFSFSTEPKAMWTQLILLAITYFFFVMGKMVFCSNVNETRKKRTVAKKKNDWMSRTSFLKKWTTVVELYT